MNYYIAYIVLVLLLVYRVRKHASFFIKKNSLKINKLNFKVDNNVFLFLISIGIIFGNIKIFDFTIGILLLLITSTFFRIEKT